VSAGRRQCDCNKHGQRNFPHPPSPSSTLPLLCRRHLLTSPCPHPRLVHHFLHDEACVLTHTCFIQATGLSGSEFCPLGSLQISACRSPHVACIPEITDLFPFPLRFGSFQMRLRTRRASGARFCRAGVKLLSPIRDIIATIFRQVGTSRVQRACSEPVLTRAGTVCDPPLLPFVILVPLFILLRSCHLQASPRAPAGLAHVFLHQGTCILSDEDICVSAAYRCISAAWLSGVTH